jgi:cell division protein FtsB
VLKDVGIALAVAALVLGAAWFDEGSGPRAWLRLQADLQEVQGRMDALRPRIEGRELESGALGEGSFAIERAIREDLGLARPGELVIRERSPSLRNP